MAAPKSVKVVPSSEYEAWTALNPDDVRWAAKPALRHRVILNFEGEAEGVRGDDVLDEILRTVKETGG